MNRTLSVYTTGDPAYIADVFTSIVMILSDEGFMYTSVKIVLLLGIILMFLQSLSQDASSLPFGKVFVAIILYLGFVEAKVDILVEPGANDPTGGYAVTGLAVPVQNVPLGLGYTASFVSTFGNSFTSTLKTIFDDPAAPNISTYDSLKAHLDLREKIQQAVVGQGMSGYYGNIKSYGSSCTRLAVVNDSLDWQSILNAPRLTEAMLYDTEIAHVPMTNAITGNIETLTCEDARQTIQNWNFDAELMEVQSAATGIPTTGNVQGYITGTLSKLHIQVDNQQNYMENMFALGPVLEAYKESRQIHQNDEGAQMLAQAVEQRNVQWASQASMFEKFVTSLSTFIEALVYSMFPIVAIGLVLAGLGLKLMGTMLSILVWIQLWGPARVIADHFLSFNVGRRMDALYQTILVTGEADSSVVQIAAYAEMQDLLGLGALMIASAPAVAGVIAFSSVGAVTNLAGKIGSGENVDHKQLAPDARDTKPAISTLPGATADPHAGLVGTGLSAIGEGIDSEVQATRGLTSSETDFEGASTSRINSRNTAAQQILSDTGSFESAADFLQSSRISGSEVDAVDARRNQSLSDTLGTSGFNESQLALYKAFDARVGGEAAAAVGTSGTRKGDGKHGVSDALWDVINGGDGSGDGGGDGPRGNAPQGGEGTGFNKTGVNVGAGVSGSAGSRSTDSVGSRAQVGEALATQRSLDVSNGYRNEIIQARSNDIKYGTRNQLSEANSSSSSQQFNQSASQEARSAHQLQRSQSLSQKVESDTKWDFPTMASQLGGQHAPGDRASARAAEIVAGDDNYKTALAKVQRNRRNVMRTPDGVLGSTPEAHRMETTANTMKVLSDAQDMEAFNSVLSAYYGLDGGGQLDEAGVSGLLNQERQDHLSAGANNARNTDFARNESETSGDGPRGVTRNAFEAGKKELEETRDSIQNTDVQQDLEQRYGEQRGQIHAEETTALEKGIQRVQGLPEQNWLESYVNSRDTPAAQRFRDERSAGSEHWPEHFQSALDSMLQNPLEMQGAPNPPNVANLHQNTAEPGTPSANSMWHIANGIREQYGYNRLEANADNQDVFLSEHHQATAEGIWNSFRNMAVSKDEAFDNHANIAGELMGHYSVTAADIQEEAAGVLGTGPEVIPEDQLPVAPPVTSVTPPGYGPKEELGNIIQPRNEDTLETIGLAVVRDTAIPDDTQVDTNRTTDNTVNASASTDQFANQSETAEIVDASTQVETGGAVLAGDSTDRTLTDTQTNADNAASSQPRQPLATEQVNDPQNANIPLGTTTLAANIINADQTATAQPAQPAQPAESRGILGAIAGALGFGTDEPAAGAATAATDQTTATESEHIPIYTANENSSAHVHGYAATPAPASEPAAAEPAAAEPAAAEPTAHQPTVDQTPAAEPAA